MILQQTQSPSIKYVTSSDSSPPKLPNTWQWNTSEFEESLQISAIFSWSRIYEKIHAKAILADQALKKWFYCWLVYLPSGLWNVMECTKEISSALAEMVRQREAVRCHTKGLNTWWMLYMSVKNYSVEYFSSLFWMSGLRKCSNHLARVPFWCWKQVSLDGCLVVWALTVESLLINMCG